MRSLKYFVRQIRRTPLPAFVALGAITLAMVVNIFIFGVLANVLLRPLPGVDHPEELVLINAVSIPDFMDWRERNTVFQDMAAYVRSGANLTGAGEPQRVQTATVSDRFWETLRVPPFRGRLFSRADCLPGSEHVLIISNGFWKSYLNSDPDVIGRKINLDDAPFTIVGVMPANAVFPSNVAVWVPLTLDKQRAGRGSNFLDVIARLKHGVALGGAQQQIQTIALQLQREYKTNLNRQITLYSLPDRLVANARPTLLVLQVAALLVLLLACANVANLSLARADVRKREFAARMALGATPSNLFRQLLAENLILTLCGAGLGLLLTQVLAKILMKVIPLELAPQMKGFSVDNIMLLFTLGLVVITGLLVSVIPFIQVYRTNVNDALKSGSTGSLSGGYFRGSGRNILFVGQICLATGLLIVSGLTLKAFFHLQQVDLGFNPENVVTMQLNFARVTPEKVPSIYNEINEMLERIRQLPGVKASSVAVYLPLQGQNITGEVHIGGAASKGQAPQVEQRVVGANYFQAMGISLLSGREFTLEDNAHAEHVAIVNKAMADEFLSGKNPIGEYVAVEDLQGNAVWMRIIGVVGNDHFYGLDKPAGAELYIPVTQIQAEITAMFMGINPLSLIVRTSSSDPKLVDNIKDRVHSVASTVPLSNIRTMKEIVSSSVAEPRLISLILSSFAAIAFLLAVFGVYALVSYFVEQRTNEIGLRMALGATRETIFRLIMKQSGWLIMIGLALGLGMAYFLSRVLARWFYGITAGDALIFSIVPAALAFFALLACFAPARRAAKIDPMNALRWE